MSMAGTLPSSLDRLVDLQYLNLYNTKTRFSNLIGTIPASWGRLTKLRDMYVARVSIYMVLYSGGF